MEDFNENELKGVLTTSKRSTKIDCSDKVNEYIDGIDWRIFANSNTGYTHAGLINNLAGGVIANFWLDSVYSKEEGDAHRNGDYHIHDLDNLAGYCFTGDTKIRVVFDENPMEVQTRSLEWLAAYKKPFKVYTMVVTTGHEHTCYGCRTSKAINCRQTRITKVVKLTFNNNSNDTVRCTPDHKFRLVNGDWVEAKDLTPDMKLLTLTMSDYHVTSIEEIDEPQHVYCLEELDTGTHSFALSNGVIVHNCCGHDLQKLLDEGFNGVMGRVGSKPPKHLREALYQMANFIGILQSEWAGAQAFSSFDTYLAPYVFFDKFYGGMSEDDVKKAIRNFVYNLNVPSRWGQCVPETYRCLKADGTWVNHKDLRIGDEIYVVDMETGKLKKDVITHVNVFNVPKKMHRYYSSDGFGFEVTDQHRVIHRKKNGEYVIQPSNELLNENVVDIPVAQWGKVTPEWYMENEYPISDEELELMAYFFVGPKNKYDHKPFTIRPFENNFTICFEKNQYNNIENLCDILNVEYAISETFEKNTVYKIRLNSRLKELYDITKNKADEFIESLSPRQASKLLDTFVLICGNFDGKKWGIYDEKISKLISSSILKSGKSIVKTGKDINPFTMTPEVIAHIGKNLVKSCKVNEIFIEDVDKPYHQVWCPTTDTGTFVCMTDEGYVFFTGNSPFSNVTIDWYVPELLRDKIPSRSGENFFLNAFKEIEEHNPDYRNSDGYRRFIEEVRSRLGELATGDDELDLMGMSYSMFQKEMHIINRCYYEVLNEGDVYGQPFTFPIPTINITEDFDWYGENTDLLFENAAKYGSSYFQNFIGSQYMIDENGIKVKDPTAYSPKDLRSMCPLTIDTKVLTKSSKGVSSQEIGALIKNIKKQNRNQKNSNQVFYNGSWYNFSIVEDIPEQDVYEISLSNGLKVKMGEFHLQPVLDKGTIMVKDIKENDWLPFSTTPVECFEDRGSYDLGFAIGAYLGDGSSNDKRIIYSLSSDEKDDKTVEILKRFWSFLGFSITTVLRGGLRTLTIGGNSFEVISRYILGDNALNKGISYKALSLSLETRRGIIDGYVSTDGQRKNGRISTSSRRMVDDLITLFIMQGERGSLSSFVDTREGRLGLNPNYIVSHPKIDKYKDKYKTIDGITYYRVLSIIKIPREKLCCIAVDSDEHLFVLANGLITHNCRLSLDLKALRKKGGGLFGASSNTGSIGVITLNMARLGYTNKGDVENFYKELDRLLELGKSSLEKKRKVVSILLERGLYPYTKRYIMNGYDNFFSTIGVNGMNEMIRNFTNDEHDIADEWGQEFAKNVLDHIREKLITFQEETGNLYNLEATPAEGTTYRFVRADLKKFPKRKVKYIECEKHGKVEITKKDIDENGEAICPLCLSNFFKK